MPLITISYRRDDSGLIVGRIFDRLVARYGRDSIFHDIDSIPPGVDFREHISRVLSATNVVLAIIGPEWIGPRGGPNRLADEADFVRIEIETALRNGVTLIPVLVMRASMPPVSSLPDSLKDIVYRNAIQIDAGQDFDVHIGRLIHAVNRIVEPLDNRISTANWETRALIVEKKSEAAIATYETQVSHGAWPTEPVVAEHTHEFERHLAPEGAELPRAVSRWAAGVTGATPVVLAPGSAPVSLREEVFRGAFFGRQHPAAAARIAAFRHLAAAEALADWFGIREAIQLAGNPEDCQAAIDRDIAAIDALIGEQLDEILHHPRLRRFEGRWRGAAWLAGGIDPTGRVKLKILNISWPELCRDLERAAEFDQSLLFQKIYEGEFGMPGGEPYGLLVIDHEVRHRPAPGATTDDVSALGQLAGVAAAAFVPTVLAASPALLQVENFTDLAMSTGLADPFRGAEFARWRALSSREDMRFIAVTLPRLLARLPWEDDPARADGFRYVEYAPDADSRVWMNAGFGFASVVARAFDNYGWPADIRGSETDYVGGGLVTDLPIEPFRTDPDHVWVRPPVDLVFTDRIEAALVEAGLMPVTVLPYCEEVVFSAVRSMQAPASYIGPNAAAANANARLSAQINSMLCVSRFAHYVKVMGRDMVGSFKTADDIERQLQEWLTGYVNASLSAGPEMRARHPLVAARVSVRERPGRPGVFGCVVMLQPHFQLDDVSATFRLVTDITSPGVSP